MVIMTGFTGMMKASLMVKDEAGRINTLEDIVARPNIIPFCMRGSTYERLFKVGTACGENERNIRQSLQPYG